jgi:hypothetical protein
MPESVSEFVGVDKRAFRRTGAFDAILDIDTRLFIDPLLLRDTKAQELRGSAERVELRFGNILRLLKNSTTTCDVWERRAEALMVFPEVKGICIGYSSRGTDGSGMGPDLRRRLLADAKEIIRVGVTDPSIFELAGLFENDVGPDRISDMVAGIIKPDLLSYTRRVFDDLDVLGPDGSLPTNPFNKQPILLVPLDVLRDLPLALDWEDIDLVASHNEELRAEVNDLIGSTWREAALKAAKPDVRKVMLEHPDILRDVIEQYRAKPRLSYDFDEDRAGQVVWHESALRSAAEFPLHLALSARPTLEDVIRIVQQICDRFKQLIEDHGLWKLLYDKRGAPKYEEAAQLLFYGVAHAYCEANNLALSPESDGGRGPVDFKFAGGYTLSAVVEVKLSRNKALKSGYTKQLPTYKTAEKARRGIYLVVDNGASPRTLRSFRELVQASPCEGLQVFEVDGTPKASASKL